MIAQLETMNEELEQSKVANEESLYQVRKYTQLVN